MHKVILVIDTVFSVTPQQYEPAYRNCVGKGHVVLVVRTKFEDLFLERDALILAQDGATPDSLSSVDDGVVFQLARDHLARYGDIFAVVMTQQAYDDWKGLGSDTAWLLRSSNAIRWVINDLTGRAESFGN